MPGKAAAEAFYAALLADDPEALYDRAPCGYLSTTPDGTITKVNHTFLTLAGYRREDLVGRRTFESLLSAGGRIYHETHYAPMLRMQGSAREIALDIVRGDGRRLPVLINSVLDRDTAGNPVVVRTAVFDATERRRYERELVLARQRAEESERRARALTRTLQQTLIPPTQPQIPGLDVGGAYRPAGTGEEVGGDFYDVFQVGPCEWVVAIGDVCGKGAEAAVVTALARHVLRGVTVTFHEPREALAVLNEALLRHETERFCTVVLVRLRLEDGVWTATVGSGGHPAPLFVRADGPLVEWGGRGPLLGVFEAPVFEDASTELAPGDSIVLFTDGVPEGRRDGEHYGVGRLEALVAGAGGSSASALAEGLVADVVAFQGGLPRDDIAVVVVRVPPQSPAHPRP